MGRGKLLRNYWPFSPSTFVTIPRSNGGFKLTRNNKLKCVSGLVNSDTFYKAPLIAKCFIIVRVYPAHCFEINISINFCMVISSCISDIFSKKPLTILCRNDMSKCCSSGRLLLLYQFQQLSIQHPVRMECRCRMPTEV